MELSSFSALVSRVQTDYHAGEYAAALELVNAQADRYPEQAALSNYWRMVLFARLQDPKRALATLRAVLDTGTWYEDVLLKKNPALRGLQEQPEFAALLRRNQELRQQDQEHTYPVIVLRSAGQCTSDQVPCPLLIALHSNRSNPQASAGQWSPVANAGWLVALPQSSQALWKNAFVWEDHEQAVQELSARLTTLFEQYQPDPQRVVWAGSAEGAEMALWLALDPLELPCAGLILVDPQGSLPGEVESWQERWQSRRAAGLRVAILQAAETNPSTSAGQNFLQTDYLHSLQNQMENAGCIYFIETYPACLHASDSARLAVDPAFESALHRALTFIFSS